jgi:hypothetical protein
MVLDAPSRRRERGTRKGALFPMERRFLSNSGFDQMAGKKSAVVRIPIPKTPRKKRMFLWTLSEVVSVGLVFWKRLSARRRKMKKGTRNPAVYLERSAKPKRSPVSRIYFFARSLSRTRKLRKADVPKDQSSASGFAICVMPTSIGEKAMRAVARRAVRSE